jgi:hypothetical protein
LRDAVATMPPRNFPGMNRTHPPPPLLRDSAQKIRPPSFISEFDALRC